jgi:hypothetical protein
LDSWKEASTSLACSSSICPSCRFSRPLQLNWSLALRSPLPRSPWTLGDQVRTQQGRSTRFLCISATSQGATSCKEELPFFISCYYPAPASFVLGKKAPSLLSFIHPSGGIVQVGDLVEGESPVSTVEGKSIFTLGQCTQSPPLSAGSKSISNSRVIFWRGICRCNRAVNAYRTLS